MDIQMIVVYLIFAICVLCAIRWFFNRITQKKSNGCGCDCPGCTSVRKADQNSCSCCPGEKNDRTCC